MNKPVIIIKREGGETDVFTSLKPRDFIDALDKGEVSGLYGSYPDLQAVDQVKGKLYVLGEEGCRVLVGEKTFYIRFGLSLIVFLIIFYFLAYMIPDPIPLVDEIAVGLGASVLFSLWHRRRVERGNRMVQQRLNVKGDIDRVEFNESPLLKEIELYLESIESRSLSEIRKRWNGEELLFTKDDGQGLLPELMRGIEQRLGRGTLKRFGRLIRRPGKENKAFDELLGRLTGDTALAVFYQKYRESLRL